MLTLLTLSTLLLNKCYSTIIEHNSIGVVEHIGETMNENNTTRSPEDLVRRLLSGGFTEQDKLKVLQTHNRYRSLTAQGLTQGQPSASNMNELLWDDALAKVAQDYSSKCTWAHNSNRVADLSNNRGLASFDYTKQAVGENLFLSSGSESIDTILQGIQYWYSEYTYYTYNTISTSGSCQSGQQCGHYTQLVWGNTRYVGCGYTKCPSVSGASFKNSVLFVCNYYFAGNVVGSYPYKSGSSASSCSSDRTPQNNLCTGCPNPSWDSYCCEYCSPASCLSAKTANLLNSPGSCTDGLGNVLEGSGAGSQPDTPRPTTSSPTPRPTNSPTAPKTNSPTTRSLGSSRRDAQDQISDDSCCSAINSRYAFFCQSITQEEQCRIYTEVCSWDDSC